MADGVMTTRGREARFGAYALRLDSLELRRDGVAVPLPPKPSAVLGALVRDAGTLVSREALYRAAWPDTVVEFDQALNTAIRTIRAALGDDAREPRFIETVPRRGYRFRHPVEFGAARVPGVTGSAAIAMHGHDHAGPAGRGGRPDRPRRPRRSSVLGSLRGVATALALVGAWTAGRYLGPAPQPLPPREAPTVHFQVAERGAGSELSALAEALEASVREQWARQARRGGSASPVSDLLVTGGVTLADDGARLDALIVRARDGSVLWQGSFNPRCPETTDPVRVIGYYLALELRRATDPGRRT